MEQNKLIAEFLQLQIHKSIDTGQHLVKWKGRQFWQSMEFHNSWDWLIPAIEKCRQENFYDSDRLLRNIEKRLITLDLTATYRNVIDFIEWYNAQKTV